jgi:hypothetical protein
MSSTPEEPRRSSCSSPRIRRSSSRRLEGHRASPATEGRPGRERGSGGIPLHARPRRPPKLAPPAPEEAVRVGGRRCARRQRPLPLPPNRSLPRVRRRGEGADRGEGRVVRSWSHRRSTWRRLGEGRHGGVSEEARTDGTKMRAIWSKIFEKHVERVRSGIFQTKLKL